MKPWFAVLVAGIILGHVLAGVYILLLARTTDLIPALMYAPVLSGSISGLALLLGVILRYRTNTRILRQYLLTDPPRNTPLDGTPPAAPKRVLVNLLQSPEKMLLRVIEQNQAEFQDQLSTQRTEYQQAVALQARLIHDIKQPISNLALVIASLPGDYRKPLEQEIQRLIRKSDQALFALRSRNLHEDFLIRPENLEELVRQAIRRQARECIAKGLGVECRLIPRESQQPARNQPSQDQPSQNKPSQDLGILPKCLVDAKWFSFIMDQILINAVKYSPSGETVEVNIAFEPGSPVAGVSVVNPAPNLGPEDIPRLGRWGYTGWQGRNPAGRDNSEVPQSTGLGLYLVGRMCRAMNIGVTPALESPQKFSITLTIPLDGGFYASHGRSQQVSP